MSVEPKQKVRYNYEFLKKYCEENNIVLLKDYCNIKIKRDTLIHAKCLFNKCDNEVNKKILNLLKTGCYCEKHTIENKQIKTKKNKHV